MDPKQPIGQLGWAVRSTFVIVVGWALYQLDDAEVVDVARLANVVTVLVPAVAVWALFDGKLLEWIVRKVRIVVERVRLSLQRRPDIPEQSAPASPPPTAPVTVLAPTAAVEPDPIYSPDPTSQLNNSTQAVPEDVLRMRDWLVALLVPLAALAFLAFLGERVWTTFIASLFEVSEPGPTGDRPGPPPPPPPPPPAEAAPAVTVTARDGDSCWAIARRCTGSGALLRELGPPLNDLDVNGECPIRAGRTITLPADWPKACAN